MSKNEHPIRKIQDDILAFLKKNPGKQFSSFQIASALEEEGIHYQSDYIQEAMGYLADAGQVSIRDRGYIFMPDDRQKIIGALEAGNVKWSLEGEAFFKEGGTISLSGSPDFTITGARVVTFWGAWEREDPDGTIRGNKGGIEVSWRTVSAGFGTITVVLNNDGKVEIDSEGMSKDFVKQVFCKLIDEAKSE
jgi:hypothetical protein